MTVYFAILGGYILVFLFYKRFKSSSYLFYILNLFIAISIYSLLLVFLAEKTIASSVTPSEGDDIAALTLHHFAGGFFGAFMGFITGSRRKLFNPNSKVFNFLMLPIFNFSFLLLKAPKSNTADYTVNSKNGFTMSVLILSVPLLKPVLQDQYDATLIAASETNRQIYKSSLIDEIARTTDFPVSVDPDTYLLMTNIQLDGEIVVISIQESEKDIINWKWDGLSNWFGSITCYYDDYLNNLEGLLYHLPVKSVFYDYNGQIRDEIFSDTLSCTG